MFMQTFLLLFSLALGYGVWLLTGNLWVSVGAFLLVNVVRILLNLRMA